MVSRSGGSFVWIEALSVFRFERWTIYITTNLSCAFRNLSDVSKTSKSQLCAMQNLLVCSGLVLREELCFVLIVFCLLEQIALLIFSFIHTWKNVRLVSLVLFYWFRKGSSYSDDESAVPIKTIHLQEFSYSSDELLILQLMRGHGLGWVVRQEADSDAVKECWDKVNLSIQVESRRQAFLFLISSWWNSL